MKRKPFNPITNGLGVLLLLAAFIIPPTFANTGAVLYLSSNPTFGPWESTINAVLSDAVSAAAYPPTVYQAELYSESTRADLTTVEVAQRSQW